MYKKHEIYYLLSVFFGILSSFLWVTFAKLMNYMIDFIQNDQVFRYVHIAVFAILYIALCRLADYFFEFCKSRYIHSQIKQMRDAYLDCIYHSHQYTENGKILSVINNDISEIQRNYLQIRVDFITYISSFFLSSFYLLQINVLITFVLYGLSLLLIMIPRLFQKVINEKQNDILLSNQALTQRIDDHNNGFYIKESFQLSDWFCRESSELNHAVYLSNIRFDQFQNIIGSVSHFVVTMIGSVGFIIGTYYTILGKMSFGNIVAVVQLTNTLVSPISQIVSLYSRYIAGKKLYRDFVKNTDISALDSSDQIVFSNSGVQSIEFQDFSVVENGYCLLHDINFKFEAGKKYLIQGKTGAGKTTLLKSIISVSTNHSGTIFINGIPQEKLEISTLLNKIYIIDQEPYLFCKTVYDNIALNREIDPLIVTNCLHDLELSDRIMQLEKKEQTIISDSYGLSGGEKQRIALARCLVKKRSVYLLDEIESAVDTKTANIIEKMIASINADIVVMTSHNAGEKIYNSFDFLITMDHGTIISVENLKNNQMKLKV